jgi:hypothetical protein
MLGDVAGSYSSAVDATDFRLARRMLEAFYVHLRLLAEFLVKPTNHKDFGSPQQPPPTQIHDWAQAERNARD